MLVAIGAVGYLRDESAPQGSAASTGKCRHLKLYTVSDKNWATECGKEFQSGMVMCTNDFWSSVMLLRGLKNFFLFYWWGIYVLHRRVISKLRLYGIDRRILRRIQAFLSDRGQLVLCDGVKSQYSRVTSGVPQVTVLYPPLFQLHINYLPSVVDPNTSVRLFMDDALVYKVINTMQRSSHPPTGLCQAWRIGQSLGYGV